MSRAVAEMMPAVTVPPSPNGLPIASTQSPTLVFDESPQLAAGSGVFASTLRSARSVTLSRPITWACSTVSSLSVTVIWSALAMTCALVTMIPDGSMMKPEPSDAARCPCGPGAPLSPKKSRNRSSSEALGDCGAVSWVVLVGAGACVVETLTTTLKRCPARCEKTSANGVSGGAAAASGGAGAAEAGAGAGAGAAGAGCGG